MIDLEAFRKLSYYSNLETGSLNVLELTEGIFGPPLKNPVNVEHVEQFTNQQIIIQTLDKYFFGVRHGKRREFSVINVCQHYVNGCFLPQQSLRKEWKV